MHGRAIVNAAGGSCVGLIILALIILLTWLVKEREKRNKIKQVFLKKVEVHVKILYLCRLQKTKLIFMLMLWWKQLLRLLVHLTRWNFLGWRSKLLSKMLGVIQGKILITNLKSPCGNLNQVFLNADKMPYCTLVFMNFLSCSVYKYLKIVINFNISNEKF